MDEFDVDPVTSDPPVLRDYSVLKTYMSPPFTYRDLRIFYHAHATTGSDDPKPLLVLLHGLGGSIAQFAMLIPFLKDHYSLLAIDLPGCGRSALHEYNYTAYRHGPLCNLIAVIINDHLGTHPHQKLFLLGHSMGSAMAARLANPLCSLHFSEKVTAIAAICPPAGPPNAAMTSAAKRMLYIPDFLLDLWRRYDRWGGIESTSVHRITGPEAPRELRERQLRYNEQSRTGTWKRMLAGILPEGFLEDGRARGGLSGREVWEGTKAPVLFVGGEADKVTRFDEIVVASEEMRKKRQEQDTVERYMFASPANHTLLYDERVVEELAQFVNDFFKKWI